MTAMAGTSAWVIELIEALWAGPDNDMCRDRPERAWDPPLIGFANGAAVQWARSPQQATTSVRAKST